MKRQERHNPAKTMVQHPTGDQLTRMHDVCTGARLHQFASSVQMSQNARSAATKHRQYADPMGHSWLRLQLSSTSPLAYWCVVAPNAMLLDVGHVTALAEEFNTVAGSRRAVPDLCADVIRDFSGEFVFPDSSPYKLPEVDNVLGWRGDFKWIGNWLNWPLSPPERGIQKRLVPRLRFLDAVMRVGQPETYLNILQKTQSAA